MIVFVAKMIINVIVMNGVWDTFQMSTGAASFWKETKQNTFDRLLFHLLQ